MSILDQFETNEKKEIEGVEISFPPNDDGSIPVFIIAATSRTNQKYSAALEKAVRPYKGNIKELGNARAEVLYRAVFVETVLKGWKNVQDRDGKEIPYSKEEALKLFQRAPRLYDRLNAEAADIENFKDAVREEQAGN